MSRRISTRKARKIRAAISNARDLMRVRLRSVTVGELSLTYAAVYVMMWGASRLERAVYERTWRASS